MTTPTPERRPWWSYVLTWDRLTPVLGAAGFVREVLRDGPERPYIIAACLVMLGALSVRPFERAVSSMLGSLPDRERRE